MPKETNLSLECLMNRIRLGVSAIIALSFAFSFPHAGARAQSTSSDADSVAIRQVIDEFVASFNRHDAHGWAMPFAEDGDFTNVTGLTKHGRSQVEERFKELFAGPLKNAHRTATVRHVRFAGPDVAFADADWALEGSLAADGSVNPVRKGIFTFFLVKQGGKWQFADFHESEFVTMK
ncbi:MAG TPA: SgcJ/EcaC family oxidoreductase [Candidatus Acidoferrales bacterium]|jgi:uncharacterized protein (TIGR02246 family)|nr:SgcJ/EcaC family oxidoreductase [Candidatus Acidoferrales bacterium]